MAGEEVEEVEEVEDVEGEETGTVLRFEIVAWLCAVARFPKTGGFHGRLKEIKGIKGIKKYGRGVGDG